MESSILKARTQICRIQKHYISSCNQRRGSWRNAFYVDCIECPYGRTDCGGHLLTADAEGTPLLLPVLLFEKMTGDKVDKFECAAIIAKEAFEKLFHSWLVWNVTDPNTCSILQTIPEDQGT